MKADLPTLPGESCLTHLDAGGTVLTASRRLARLVRQRYDSAQAAAGRRVWPTAQVLPLESWLGATWFAGARQHADPSRLLSDLQAEQPWRRAVEASPPADTLLAVPDLAAAGRRAWLLLGQHGGTLAQLDADRLTLDQAAFRRWAVAVEADLRSRRWLDPGLLASLIAAWPPLALQGPPLLLAGFARLRPDQQSLLAALRAAGRSVRVLPVAGAMRRVSRYEAPDPRAETTAMLAWTRAQLERNPKARLALIVPDLAQRRAELERGLTATLDPRLELPGGSAQARVFDLAGGAPLAALRVVADALDMLAAARWAVEFDVVARLLRSPYVGGATTEAERRIRFDAWLRAAGLEQWPVPVLATAAREHGAGLVAAALERSHALLGAVRGRQKAGDWARLIGQVLATWGWPGERTLASDEYQAARALREALEALATLDDVGSPLDAAGALAEFRRLCARSFQPERGSPLVVVYDRFEAPGIEFDGLWVAGLSAANLPRAPVPDPLLPVSLQCALTIAGATPEDCRKEAEALVQAWCGTGAEVVLSWPVHQDDARVEGSRLVPMEALLAPLPGWPLQVTRAYGQRARCESIPASQPAPLEPAAARGTSRLFELQAQCPFRAFAEFRLGASVVEEPAPGIDRRTRGQVLHHALDLFWAATRDSEALAAQSAEERADLIRRSVEQALRRHLPPGTGLRARVLEADWQAAAASALAAADSGRPAFAVLEREQALQATLSGMPVSLRVDRIDSVAGQLLVIDYKTGKAASGGWSGARMDAPQLPLYAALHSRDIAGVALVRVQPDAAAYAGVAADAGLLPGLQPAEDFEIDAGESGLGWPGIKARWHAWLGRLADDYLAGHARVDPKRPDTCRTCHLETLCRVRGRFEPDEADAAEAGSDG